MPRPTSLLAVALGTAVLTWSLTAFDPGAHMPYAGQDDPSLDEARVTTPAPGKRLALISLSQPVIQSSSGDVTNVAGAECPTGSGNYCSDELPYCCPGVSVDPYCAADVNRCTQ